MPCRHSLHGSFRRVSPLDFEVVFFFNVPWYVSMDGSQDCSTYIEYGSIVYQVDLTR